MILNVSGRCDIVAFFTPWFIHRIQEGFFDVRNPFHSEMVSRIYYEDVDAIVFCTKNPRPIIPYLKDIHKPILFHITFTAYHTDIEENVKSKKEIIQDILDVSSILGTENVVVRYDPIFLSKKYTISYHIKAFQKICELLDGKVSKIIISFLDEYKNVKSHYNVLQYHDFTEEDYKMIGTHFSQLAHQHHLQVHTCFENRTLVEYGFDAGECLSHELAYIMTGKKYPNWKARKEKKCHCVEMVDIGAYNCCHHKCRYCYANYDENQISFNMKHHNPNSSLLIGNLKKEDIIKIRKS